MVLPTRSVEYIWNQWLKMSRNTRPTASSSRWGYRVARTMSRPVVANLWDAGCVRGHGGFMTVGLYV